MAADKLPSVEELYKQLSVDFNAKADLEPGSPEALAAGCKCEPWAGPGNHRWNTSSCRFHCPYLTGEVAEDNLWSEAWRQRYTLEGYRFDKASAEEALQAFKNEFWGFGDIVGVRVICDHLGYKLQILREKAWQPDPRLPEKSYKNVFIEYENVGAFEPLR